MELNITTNLNNFKWRGYFVVTLEVNRTLKLLKMKHTFFYLLPLSTTIVILLMIPFPNTSEMLMQNHRRGKVPYPKTMQVWSDELDKMVTVYMEESPDPEPRFNPDTEIYYYIHKRDSHPKKIDLKNIEKNNKDIDPNADWYIGLHGWLGSYKKTPMKDVLIKDIYAYRPANIIHVDWGAGANLYWYPSAVRNLYKIGDPIAKVLNRLVEKGLMRKGDVHLIGNSLGGHGVGFIGKSLIRNHGWKPRRITSLDPAGPSFDGNPAYSRIDKEDGVFVEVIHSCGNWLGYWYPIGTADIYVNTGLTHQPGCHGIHDATGSCSHRFAIVCYGNYTHLMMKSYKCTSFEDYTKGKCNHDYNTYHMMGFKYPDSKPGVFHLDTESYFHRE